MQGSYSTGNFVFNYRFISKSFNQNLIIADSILYNFEVEDLPVDVLAVKGLRTVDVHGLLDVVEHYSRVIFMLGGNDTDSWPKKNRFGQMQLRNAGSVQEIADELEDLSVAAAEKKVEVWVAGILPRLIKTKPKKMFTP